jgi:hypothetical protein
VKILVKCYVYKNQDVTLDILMKIEQVVSIIADRDALAFDNAYENFSHSKVFCSLENTATLMWAESAEFIVDEYYSEVTFNT